MVKTLQKKFMAASMLAVTLLLVTLVGAINILNAVSVYRRQGQILETLCETDAQPEDQQRGRFDEKDPGEKPDAGIQERPELPRGDDREPRRMDAGRGLTVDNVLSARYFAAWTDAEGTVVRTDVSRIYAVDEESAALYAREILALDRDKGSWHGFRYMVKDLAEDDAETETGGSADAPVTEADETEAAETGGSLSGQAGGRLLIAMDVSSDRSGILTTLGISALIAVLCWIAMLWPVHLLSARSIAPTAMSIERQKQFVTNAGHELKTPLAIIQANTEALELYTGESKWTRNIRAQTVRLSGLMQNLLTLSKMDESGLQLDLHPFLLDELAGEAWRDFAAPAEARSLTVRFDLPRASEEEEGAGPAGTGADPADREDRGSVTALGNRDSVAQLLSILYDNAVKYTPRGGEIRVRVRQTADGVVLEQSNTAGPERPEEGGGPREDPERLFERFYRADADRSRKKGGYGIGLSAARAIAEANRGSIHARYEGDRIVFTVRLGSG